MTTRRGWTRLIAVAATVAVAACTPAPRAEVPRPSAPQPQPPAVEAAQAQPRTVACKGSTASLRPDGTELTKLPRGGVIDQIRQRGLRVGVSQTAGRLSSRNLRTGAVEGLEADLAIEIARAIYPDRDPAKVPDLIQYVAMPTRDRFLALNTAENGKYPPATNVAKVDLIIADASVTCERVDTFGVRFSAPYLQTRQGLLTYRGTLGDWDPRTGITGRTVCAGAGTINLDRITKLGGIAVPVVDTTDCLVQLQRHQVDAVSTDDVILEGFRDQDPNTEIFPGVVDTVDVAAVAIANRDEDLVRLVNAVLERMRGQGMTRLYDKWFSGRAMVMPPADYEGR
ncbi:transporter substrate-binding domain-containing protein [Actinokineospora diospyrosa]|uniref:Polar amino acid transport system substrate-binding protein n=1 Tax=Actinokineospora diospyrosa TaxID=103728 RepID=A0ABT1I8S3_9PSEU|nr:transporter substrate-binding domain-containing protein [Actinokineospora diospyrosa]MCP2269034.1 polar amino acid transport system substrate-binding protein [Actinokineospora diospyrosa]